MSTRRKTAADEAKDRTLFQAASKVRRHLVTCGQCKSARKTEFYGDMCREGKVYMARMAEAWDYMLDIRKSIDSENRGLIYACPDPAVHGEGYHLCAEMYSVNGVQPGLF